ncbi:sodium transporter, partial [Enterococcus faecium]
LSLKTLYRKRTVIWPFYFYTIIRTLSDFAFKKTFKHLEIPNTYSGKSILRFTKRTFVRTLFLR